jgi:hypothetical protein
MHIRAATSSLTDLEMKLNKAIERNVILGKLVTKKPFEFHCILTSSHF